MRRFGVILLALVLPGTPLHLASESDTATGAATATRPTLLLGDRYPIETGVLFHAALLHWLDSLAALAGPGMTAGKTVEAHRMDFRQALGEPDEQDIQQLRRFAQARTRFASSNADSVNQLTVAFFEESSVTTALERVQPLLSVTDLLQQFSDAVIGGNAHQRGDQQGPAFAAGLP